MQVFGLATENGPLEAGWSVASFARALELLRGEVDGWDHTYGLFKTWVDKLLMPLMDSYVNSTDLVIKEGKPNVLGNWHSTIAGKGDQQASGWKPCFGSEYLKVARGLCLGTRHGQIDNVSLSSDALLPQLRLATATQHLNHVLSTTIVVHLRQPFTGASGPMHSVYLVEEVHTLKITALHLLARFCIENAHLAADTDLFASSLEPSVPCVSYNFLSLAEAWMSVAILSDDRPRYNKAVQLYHATVKDYFKWGRGKYRNYSGVLRVVGEATETLRDIYHTQFGLGGLLQTAEMAWQQVRTSDRR